jgi:hypothetical protein
MEKFKRKTDKDDALKLVEMTRNNEVNSGLYTPEHRQFQHLKTPFWPTDGSWRRVCPW